ncbi:hypothetical protein RIEPE_0210 [Candidatus Riesia pediculicola USDA]|uniref:Uncharacterized protein n=1 Tax=Riesia pediculicola (strain USDA) TaxID=515618 RepID=D4G818_RIEPU|nr:hypothetical protein RIEPE_0210 [Candidatus Riesia pediculicola USDA]ARC53726.1 hypothetical protein AOE55_00945 [Candidatus Riesia pediculicola]
MYNFSIKKEIKKIRYKILIIFYFKSKKRIQLYKCFLNRFYSISTSKKFEKNQFFNFNLNIFSLRNLRKKKTDFSYIELIYKLFIH